MFLRHSSIPFIEMYIFIRLMRMRGEGREKKESGIEDFFLVQKEQW